LDSIEERHQKVTDEIASMESVDKTALELLDKLKKLQKEIGRTDAWAKDSDATDKQINVSNESA
jgi:hypothetical protein